MRFLSNSTIFYLALGLIAESVASSWAFTGYVVEDGVEWFSLRASDGTAAWVAVGKPGPVVIREFDRATLTLFVETDGKVAQLTMPEARLNAYQVESVAPAKTALSHVALPRLPPLLPSASAADRKARQALEALQVSYAATRIEQAEAMRNRDVAIIRHHQEAQTKAASSSILPVSTPSGQGVPESPALAPKNGEPDWHAIYRAVAIRRAAYEVKLAEQRLQREGQQ